MSDQQRGREFEVKFAERMGLKAVPGSGSHWTSKMDVQGLGGRWSLKSTRFGSFQMSLELFRELLEAVAGSAGTGEIPLSAVELLNTSEKPVVIISMLEDDFKLLAQDQYKLVRERKSEAKRREAEIPQLLREEN